MISRCKSILFAYLPLSQLIICNGRALQKDALALASVVASSTKENIFGKPWTKCSSQRNCDSCYSASPHCHWCPNGECHLRSNVIEGCDVGVTCPRKFISETEKHLNQVCASHSTCTDCQTSPTNGCQWCHDKKCHHPASVHGCGIPIRCNNRKKRNKIQCDLHTNCTSCKASPHDCNWCGKDKKCHAKGSLFGCDFSEMCDGESNKANEMIDLDCQSHPTCTECVLSSPSCHFCSSDNKCHAKGVENGCVEGTECYSEQCERKYPEKNSEVIKENKTRYEDKGIVKILIHCFIVLGVLLASFIMSTSIFFSRNSCARVGDLCSFSRGVSVQVDEDNNESITHPWSLSFELIDRDESIEFSTSSSTPLLTNTLKKTKEKSKSYFKTSKSNITLNNDELVTTSMQKSDSFESIKKSVPKLDVCLGAMSIIIGIIFVTLTILLFIYFPLQPTIDYCGHSLDFEKVLFSESRQLVISFQLLFSGYNPNNVNVLVLNGFGNVFHEGEYLGKGTVSPVLKIEQKAINDVIVSLTLNATRLKGLLFFDKYATGELELTTDIYARMMFPSLLGKLAFPLKLKNRPIKIYRNKTGELCNCTSISRFLTDFGGNKME